MLFSHILHPLSRTVYLHVLFKYSFDSLISVLIIVLNILLIISLISIKHHRASQSLLLVNLSIACLFFSLSCLLSIGTSLYFLWLDRIYYLFCQISGFCLITSCHCLMFSYTCVTAVRFLSVIYPFNRKFTSIQAIRIYVIIPWIFALLIALLSLIVPGQHISFQTKAKICFMNQKSSILWIYFCTGCIIPIVFISLMNLITYLNVQRSHKLISFSQRKCSRLNKRKRRNLRLLRQFSLFTIVFLFSWTPFIVIELLDRDEKLSDLIYLYSLSSPIVGVLIDSSLIFHGNQLIQRRKRMIGRARCSMGSTTAAVF